MLRPEQYMRLSAGSPTTYLKLHRTKELTIPCQGRTPHPAVVCACVAAGSLQLDRGIWLAVVEQTAMPLTVQNFPHWQDVQRL